MKQHEHIAMVGVLVKAPAKIKQSLTWSKVHLLHMLIGIGDEYFEAEEALMDLSDEDVTGSQVDDRQTKMAKELGDLLFYTEGTMLHLEFDESESAQHTILMAEGKSGDYTELPFNQAMKGYFELGKRHVIYEEPMNVKLLVSCYFSILECIRFNAAEIGKTMDEIRQMNRDKLGDRYEDLIYTDQRATDRKDTIESPDELTSDQLKYKQLKDEGYRAYNGRFYKTKIGAMPLSHWGFDDDTCFSFMERMGK